MQKLKWRYLNFQRISDCKFVRQLSVHSKITTPLQINLVRRAKWQGNDTCGQYQGGLIPGNVHLWSTPCAVGWLLQPYHQHGTEPWPGTWIFKFKCKRINRESLLNRKGKLKLGLIIVDDLAFSKYTQIVKISMISHVIDKKSRKQNQKLRIVWLLSNNTYRQQLATSRCIGPVT
jgi:hypothetical protein